MVHVFRVWYVHGNKLVILTNALEFSSFVKTIDLGHWFEDFYEFAESTPYDCKIRIQTK